MCYSTFLEIMNLKEKQDALVEEITLIPDAYERLGYIVDRGKKAVAVDSW